MTSPIGQSIGRYHILEQLGEGGMATVYKAFDTRLEREVALKMILPTRKQSPKFLKRFEREAKSLAQLSHPNIVKIHDYGEYEGLPYLVMEYTPAGTLKDRLGEAMDVSEASRLLAPIARALAYAHVQKIVHRDIKPSNILITQSGQPMLSDFGIAKMLEAEETWDLTGTGVGIGTPEYMAPEQGMGKPIDHRVDVYALGIVFYEMVTGRKPFRADTPLAVLLKQVNDPLPQPRAIVPDLPKAAEQLILKALAKKPENRHADIGKFAGALESLAQERRVRMAPAIVGRDKGARPALLRYGMIGAAVVAAVALSIFGLRAIGVFQGPGAEPVPPTAAAEPDDTRVTATAAPAAAGEIAPCEDPQGCISIAPGEPILLGYMLWLGHPLGVEAQRAIEIALQDRGEVFGRAVDLVGEDTGCTPEGGQQVADRISENENVVAVVGTTCSPAAQGAAPVLDEAGLTMVSPGAIYPLLTAPGTHVRSFLRVSTNGAEQARLMAHFVYQQLGLRTAATVDDDGTLSQSIQPIFAEAFTELGGTIVSQHRVNAGDEDMRPVLRAIASQSPDLIYFALITAEGATLTIQAQEVAGLEGTVLAGSEALMVADFLAEAGSSAEGVYLTIPAFDMERDAYRAFLDKYLLRYGEAPQTNYHAYAYDATMMILSAIEQVAVSDADGNLFLGRQAMREALYGTRDFVGLTGTLSCAPSGECGPQRYVVQQVQQGDFERVFDATPVFGPEAIRFVGADLVLNGSDFSAVSGISAPNWIVDGTAVYTHAQDRWVEYQAELTPGRWRVGLEAINHGSLGEDPSWYRQFELSVSLGSETLYIQASDTQVHHGAVGFDVLSDGTYTARFTWLNDKHQAPLAEGDPELDANIRIERVFFDAIPNLEPGQWIENPANGHRYALTDANLPFDEAEAQAVSWGSHLVTIDDQAEQDWLYETFGPEPFWIGLNDITTEGTFEWASGASVMYTNWCYGEPNDSAPGEDAVQSSMALAEQCWNDMPVDSIMHGVAELEN